MFLALAMAITFLSIGASAFTIDLTDDFDTFLKDEFGAEPGDADFYDYLVDAGFFDLVDDLQDWLDALLAALGDFIKGEISGSGAKAYFQTQWDGLDADLVNDLLPGYAFTYLKNLLDGIDGARPDPLDLPGVEDIAKDPAFLNALLAALKNGLAANGWGSLLGSLGIVDSDLIEFAEGFNDEYPFPEEPPVVTPVPALCGCDECFDCDCTADPAECTCDCCKPVVTPPKDALCGCTVCKDCDCTTDKTACKCACCKPVPPPAKTLYETTWEAFDKEEFKLEKDLDKWFKKVIDKLEKWANKKYNKNMTNKEFTDALKKFDDFYKKQSDKLEKEIEAYLKADNAALADQNNKAKVDASVAAYKKAMLTQLSLYQNLTVTLLPNNIVKFYGGNVFTNFFPFLWAGIVRYVAFGWVWLPVNPMFFSNFADMALAPRALAA